MTAECSGFSMLYEIRLNGDNQNRWVSNIPEQVYSHLFQEAKKQMEEDQLDVRGNDMLLFYYLSGGQFPVRKARRELTRNIDRIKNLIEKYKFAPFPLQQKDQIYTPENIEISLCVAFDDCMHVDGYERAS